MPAPDVEALLAQMTLDEKIGQMTQADKNALKDGRDDPRAPHGLGPVGRRLAPQAERSCHLGGDDRPLPEPGAVDPPGHPDDLRRRRGPRRRRRQGLGALPAPHRAGRHPQPRPRPEGGARDGARGRRHRRALDVRPLHRGRARRALGTHLRELWRVTRAGRVAGSGRGPRFSGRSTTAARSSPAPSTSSATAGPSTERTRGTRASQKRSCARSISPATVACIKAGVGNVMVSYSSWNGAPMHGNKTLITDLLKGELGFAGFVVTDWAAIDKMSKDYKQDVEVAINAGIDMVMVPNRYREFVADMKELVTAGRIPMARIDDAVRRILKQKARFKLWERPFTDPALTAQIGSAEHRAVARAGGAAEPGRAEERQERAAAREQRAGASVRLPRRRHGRAVRRLVGRLARPPRRDHAGDDDPPGVRTGAGRWARRLLEGRRWRRKSRRGGGRRRRGSLRRRERRPGQAGARRRRPRADRRRQAERQAAGDRASSRDGR